MFQAAVIFFSFGELFLYHFFQSRSDSGKSLHFLHLLISLFHLHSWKIFSLDTELWVVILFFQHFKNVLPLSSLLHGFWWGIYSFSNFSFSVGNTLFLSSCFKDFSFIFNFQTFDYDVSGCWFIWVYSFRVCSEFWIGRFMSFAKFGKFSAIISSNIFCALHSFSSPSGTPVTWVLDLLLLYHRYLFFFFSVLSLLFRLDHFYWYIFRFTDSFLLNLHFAIESIQ